MEKEEIPSGNKNDPAEKEKSSPVLPPLGLGVKAISEEGETDNPTNKPRNNSIDKIKNWFKKKRNQRTVLTWVNIGMLGAFIGFSLYQGCKTRESIDLSTKAFNKACVSDSIDSIMTVIDTTTRGKNTRTELRAYVVVTNIKIDTINKTHIQFSAVCSNTGKTPAYSVMAFASAKVGGTGVYENEINDAIGKDTTTAMQGNGMNFTLAFPPMELSSPNSNIIDFVLAGRVGVYTYGVLFYYDVFGIKHRTRFCYFVAFRRYGEYQGWAYKY